MLLCFKNFVSGLESQSDDSSMESAAFYKLSHIQDCQ